VIKLLASATAVLFLDQWSKRMVEVHLAHRSISWSPVLQMRYLTAHRAGYERNSARALLVLVWLIALAAAVMLYRSGSRFRTGPALFGLGSALGGAAGNLLDILRRRGVTDFIDLRWWPAFNLADVAIVGGLVVAFWAAI
jgi:signal peptidase II